MRKLGLLGCLVICLIGGSARLLWAQPPPPAAVAATAMDVPGVGPITPLLDLAQGDCAFSAKLDVTDAASLKLTVILDHDPQSGSHYQLRLTAKEAQFFLFKDGKAGPLGEAAATPALPAAGTLTDLVVRRDGWRLALLLDDHLVCTAYDGSLTTGNIGYALAGGTLVRTVLQSVGDIYFSDDFMRAEGETDLWKPAAGQWKETSLRIDPQATTMQEERSSNAFSYEGHALPLAVGGAPVDRALSVAGYWFWADYRVEAAIRPLGDGAVGLVACYRDPANYVALRWTPISSNAADGNRLQLIERVRGQERVISETPGGYREDQWYKLALGISDGCVSAWLDDEFRLTGRTTAFMQGKCGLLQEGADGANFDDVMLAPWGYSADDFSSARRWDTQSGAWQRGDHRLACPGGSGLILERPCTWSHFAYTADCHVEKGAGGVVFGYVSPEQYYALSYVAGDAPRAELVQVAGGQSKVLGAAPVEKSAGQAVRLGVEVNRNLVTGIVGDRAVLHLALETPPAGRLGLWAGGAPGAWFSYAVAERLEPPPAAHVTKEFRNDTEHWEMAKWSTSRSPWVIPTEFLIEHTDHALALKDVNGPSEFGQSVWWSKGDFYGGTSVVFPLTGVGQVAGSLKVAVYADPDKNVQPVGGYLLTLTSQRGPTDLLVTLTQGATKLGEAKVAVPTHKCQVEFARSGPYFQVWIGSALVIQTQVSQQ